MLEFSIFLGIGFLMQIIDGALRMAYIIISISILLSMEIALRAVSGAIHAAEILTTGISDLSHAMFKNIYDYRLFRRFILLRIIGRVSLEPIFLIKVAENIIKLIVSIYLFGIGVIILYRVFHKINWMKNIIQLIHKILDY
ncbi:hypothetical protein B1F79_05070 [Coxiella-like endosymbiont of Rhipicephalus sanguineus]|uniref:hypothetical protein n=1 Tax=Coxiella-like endosymbiont of Rhipicephalus sanguineus TaxID=1955402 RepID=UPI00203AB376|nr:hypothetical protein [Coxiella-like endosymbiont of Rhipicephalus sanguineus]MBT8506783.1 hypothetical protein [Coxiella-like endosymbiont of Rhipicephalus sanguineus]